MAQRHKMHNAHKSHSYEMSVIKYAGVWSIHLPTGAGVWSVHPPAAAAVWSVGDIWALYAKEDPCKR